MADKRDNYRHLKRLPVKFFMGEFSGSGYTEDISHYGLFIKAGLVQGPGRQLTVELSLPEDRLVRMVARIQWAKRVPPSLLRTCKGGMGFTIVRFLDGEEHYRALCDELHQIHIERNSVGVKSVVCDEGQQ